MNLILWKAADLTQGTVIERASSQIPIEQHGWLRWRFTKTLKWSLKWIAIDWNQSLQQKLSQIKSAVWEPCMSFDFRFNQRFFEKSASENHHSLCYWPTINNWICSKFQVLSSHIWGRWPAWRRLRGKFTKRKYFNQSIFCCRELWCNLPHLHIWL